MRMLIELNNSVGQWLGEICAIFYLIAAIALLRAWKQSRAPDALVIFFYLTALIWAVYLPNTWLNLTSLMIFHLFAYTSLAWLHWSQGRLRTVFGDYFLLMAGMMCLVDAIWLGWSLQIQYQVWLIDLIFITMCLSTLYCCLNSHHNRGNIGRKNDKNYTNSKIVMESLKGRRL